jgi:hypothetical protein
MSGGLYNLVHGVNPSTFLILPMLGKHPDEYYRFRDCFVSENDTILIFTRGKDEYNNLTNNPNFIKTWKWYEDETYHYYEFSVPDKWKSDFKLITENDLHNVSKEYIDEICRVYPKISDKITEIFKRYGNDK